MSGLLPGRCVYESQKHPVANLQQTCNGAAVHPQLMTFLGQEQQMRAKGRKCMLKPGRCDELLPTLLFHVPYMTMFHGTSNLNGPQNNIGNYLGPCSNCSIHHDPVGEKFVSESPGMIRICRLP